MKTSVDLSDVNEMKVVNEPMIVCECMCSMVREQQVTSQGICFNDTAVR